MSLWTRDGILIRNAAGNLVDCPTCPCVGTGTETIVSTLCCAAVPEVLNIRVIARISDGPDTTIYTTKDYGVQQFVYTDLAAAGWVLTPESTQPAWLKEFELWEASDTYPLRLAMICGYDSNPTEWALYAASNYNASPTTLTRMSVSTFYPYTCDPLLWEISMTTEIAPSVIIGRLGGYTLTDPYARFEIQIYE